MTTHAGLDPAALRAVVERALEEDCAGADVTTHSIFGPDDRLSGRIVSRASGVLAGLPVARAVFLCLEPDFRLQGALEDGDRLSPGSVIARLGGRARALLAGERVALNFLQRLSGIATLTSRYVEQVSGTGTRILDTRKTTPGLRALEKYAVRVGGGFNHRFSLEDMVLIKDNHIEAAGSIRRAVQEVRRGAPGRVVEVEVQDLDQLEEVLDLKVDRVMLDNFDLDAMRRAVERIGQAAGRRPEVEVSGGVGLERAAEVARVGVDYISVGALTHSAASLDINMEIES